MPFIRCDPRRSPSTFESLQCKLARVEGLGETLGCTAFAAAQARQSGKCLRVEPILGLLRAEILVQQLDLSLHDGVGRGDVDARPTEIAVPFWNFVFQDQMIPE